MSLCEVTPRTSRRVAYFFGAVVVAISLAFFAERSTRTVQADAGGIIQISLATRDLLYDPVRNTIYASVPSSASSNANSVVSINPATGQVQGPITSGGNPSSIALSGDGHYLYAGLDDNASVRRFDLQSQTQAPPEFSLGIGGFGRPNKAVEIEVLPGHPQSLAIALDDGFVAIFDDGTQRPSKPLSYHQTT